MSSGRSPNDGNAGLRAQGSQPNSPASGTRPSQLSPRSGPSPRGAGGQASPATGRPGQPSPLRPSQLTSDEAAQARAGSRQAAGPQLVQGPLLPRPTGAPARGSAPGPFPYPPNPGYTGPIGSAPSTGSHQTRPQPPSDPTRLTHLHNLAREALNNPRDRELQSLLAERYHRVPATARPPLPQILDMTARFLDLANLRVEARLALIYLANAGWGFEDAFGRYMGERYDEMEGPGQGQGKGEVEEEDEEGSISEFSDEFDPTTGPSSPRSLLAAANPSISRSPALKSAPDPTKTTLRLTNTPGKPAITRTYPHPVDWSSADSIRALNRWRQQTLRRLLGPAREERVSFHRREVEWLVQVHRCFAREAGGGVRGGERVGEVDWAGMDWDRVARRFNEVFEGTSLDGGAARPRRTKGALRSVRGRVPEIVEMTGLAARPLKEMKGETKSADPKKKDDNDESGNRDRNDKDDRGGKKGGSSRK